MPLKGWNVVFAVVALLALAWFLSPGQAVSGEKRGSGDLAVIVERASGGLVIANTTKRKVLHRITGLGDLSHASVVFSRDTLNAFIFGRDGGLSKVDLLSGELVSRVIQAGNSIGGAISQDGKMVAVSNYDPGGVKVFDTDSLDQVTEIAAITGDGKRSKVVGLVDAPGGNFVFTLYDAGEIWIAGMKQPSQPVLTKFHNIGSLPYDGLITPDGRYYLAGLFGEDGVALLDLWSPQQGVRRVLDGYGRGEEPLPVYKMPHLEGWAEAGGLLFLPAVGRHEVLIVSRDDWREVGRIPVHGQPVFVIARPDGRQVWVTFAHPLNDTVQVIDVASKQVVRELKPGPAVLHLEFTPRGEQVWVSVRDDDKVVIYDTDNFAELGEITAAKPSGIFMSARAHRIGL